MKKDQVIQAICFAGFCPYTVQVSNTQIYVRPPPICNSQCSLQSILSMGSCDGGGVASGTVSENKGTKGIRNWYLIRKTRETLPTIKMNESTKISTSYMKPFPFFELKMCWAWCLVCQLHPPSFLERKKGIKKM